jgi:hypothetical protein
MSDEFPKMLTVRRGNRIVPLIYPPGHVRHGQHVVFADADEEKAYERDKIGVPADTRPEQVGQQVYYPVYLI